VFLCNIKTHWCNYPHIYGYWHKTGSGERVPRMY
jgi:hypothetical protein